MDEFQKLERNLNGTDPHLERALEQPDSETPQAAFDAFAAGEHKAELHILPERSVARTATAAAVQAPEQPATNVIQFPSKH